jgi:hypothetical protein
MIFVQLILENFCDNHFSSLLIGQKQYRERERKKKEEEEERIRTHESMREMIVSKVVKKWLYKYHFS